MFVSQARRTESRASLTEVAAWSGYMDVSGHHSSFKEAVWGLRLGFRVMVWLERGLVWILETQEMV